MKRNVYLFLILVGIAGQVAAAEKSKVKEGQAPVKSQAESVVLDHFELADWNASGADNTVIRTSLTEGKEGKALQVNYDLKDTKQWVQFNKKMVMDKIEGKAVQFYLKVIGEKTNNLEIKLVDGDGSNYGYKMPLNPANDWQTVTVPADEFSYWWGGTPELNGVKSIWIGISHNEGGQGTIVLDELRLVSSDKKPVSKVSSGLIDNCDSLEGWKAEGDKGSVAKLAETAGKQGKAVQLQYDLGSGKWVQEYKIIPLELSGKTVIRFLGKYEGEDNTLEFKIADAGSPANYVKKMSLSDFGEAGAWHEVKIPFSEVKEDAGEEKVQAKGIWIAISGSGKGSFALDQLLLQ